MGLVSGVLVLTSRARLPWVAGAVFVLAVASIELGGYPSTVALGYAATSILYALATKRRMSEEPPEPVVV